MSTKDSFETPRQYIIRLINIENCFFFNSSFELPRKPNRSLTVSDFQITPVKSGDTVRLTIRGTKICSESNLGLIFYNVLIQKSEIPWKVLSGCLKNLSLGIPIGHQTFPWCCAPRKRLVTLGNSLGPIFPDNNCGRSTVCTTHASSIKLIKKQLHKS